MSIISASTSITSASITPIASIASTVEIASTPKHPARVVGPLRVPWTTVLPLALVMAFGDGFWLTSLRGAVGAIERTQSPFASWLRESTLVLPVFVFAVLGAMTLALRLFGPVLRKGRTVLAAAVLVSVAGTVAGLGVITASSAYDYHLQSLQLRAMNSMHSCVGSCLAQQQHATLALQIHAVEAASGLLIVTNLVLVAWMVAMWGGRLAISTTNVRRTRFTRRIAAQFSALAGDRDKDLRMLAVAGLLAGAAVHTALVPIHLSQWPVAGAFFMLLSAAEIIIASKLVMVWQRSTLLAAVVVCIAPLGLWLYSRTEGLPFGPGAGVPQAVGLTDCIVCGLEVATLLAVLVLLRTRGRLELRAPVSAHVRAAFLVAVVAAVVVGLAATSLTWSGDFATSAHQSALFTSH